MFTFTDVELRGWIDGLVETRYKTVRALAVAIGMTESGFSRAVKAGTFEVENCLRLAHETGESAANVLAMAGKPHINDLIEKLYGKAQKSKDGEAVKAGELFEKLKSSQAREGFLLVLDGLVEQERLAKKGKGTPT